jgi:outer membrane translocation and assembly module TamA
VKGTLLDLNVHLYDEALGSDFDYEKYRLSYNRYLSVGEAAVVAVRGHLCGTGGDVPFFGLCLFGKSADLRGYPGGRYRDGAMVAVQGEYRRQFTSRWGAVGFAGVGEVGEEIGDLGGDNLLPSVGVGVRFMLSKEQKVNIRADFAWGDGDDGFYLGLGEAF